MATLTESGVVQNQNALCCQLYVIEIIFNRTGVDFEE